MKKISFYIAGDFAPVAHQGIKWDQDFQNIIDQNAFGILNLEAPLLKKKNLKDNSDKIRLAIDPDTVNILKELNIEAVCLANNHIFDHGIEGFSRSIDQLDNKNIKYFGAGENLDEALSPVYFTLNNTTYAFLGVCSSATHPSHIADFNSPGIAPLEKDLITDSVIKLKDTADFIVLMVHWGTEYHSYPSQYQIEWYNFFRKINIDIVAGHHTHSIQPDLLYNDMWLSFSLGNFVFDDVYQDDSRFPVVKQSKLSRTGKILQVNSKTKKITRFILYYNRSGKIEFLKRKHSNDDATDNINKLKSEIYISQFYLFNKIRDIKIALRKIISLKNLFNIHKIRFRHIKYIIKLIFSTKNF